MCAHRPFDTIDSQSTHHHGQYANMVNIEQNCVHGKDDNPWQCKVEMEENEVVADETLVDPHSGQQIDPIDQIRNENQWPTKEELEKRANEAKNRKLRHYYNRQIEMLKNFKADREFTEKFIQNEEEVKRELKIESTTKTDDILTKVSLLANIILLCGIITAEALSGSLVVLGAVVDSAMDTTVSLMIFFANRAIRKRNAYKYPRGRTRLEPIAILVVSVIMGAVSVQVISKSLESIAEHKLGLKVDLVVISIMIGTVVIKFSLMVACCMFRSPNTVVLAQDHANDCVANVVALICLFIANRYWIYMDPIGAIGVSIYILISWIKIGTEHAKILSGRTASPEFINRMVKICLDHKPEVKKVDTVLVYHYGTKYLVEVHIVLDETISVKEAHDISEPLQRKIEYLPHVERVFMHIDYETDHRPDYEHKVV